MITAAMADGIIAESEHFYLHGLKHRDITDTSGS